MPGDEGGKGGGGDRVAVGVVDGMRYHVSRVFNEVWGARTDARWGVMYGRG